MAAPFTLTSPRHTPIPGRGGCLGHPGGNLAVSGERQQPISWTRTPLLATAGVEGRWPAIGRIRDRLLLGGLARGAFAPAPEIGHPGDALV